MKISKIVILSFTFLMLLNGCVAQKIVQQPHDVYKLKNKESEFVNKPLELLLGQITPAIKMVTVTPTNNSQSRLGNFSFRFVDFKQNDSAYAKGRSSVRLTVYVKEPFEWNQTERLLDKKYTWTKEDENKYKNLTVIGIRVSGE